MKQKDRTFNRKYILLMACYTGISAIVYGFGTYLLISRGFNSQEAGLAMALANVLSVIVQPIVSNFLDNSKKITVFDAVVIGAGIVMISFLLNCFMFEKSIVLMIDFILYLGLFAALEPLTYALSNMYCLNGVEVNFGAARAFGSISYGIICTIFGIISEKISYLAVLYAGLFITIAFFAMALINRKASLSIDLKVTEQKQESISFKEFVLGNKQYMVICFFLAGIMCSYTGIDNFMILVTEGVGGTSQDMGIILGMKAILEAFAIFFFAKLIKRVRLETLLSISAIGFMAKLYMTYIAKSLVVLYLSQILQMFSFAIILPGMVEYVARYMKKNEIVRGQAFYTMSTVLGAIVSSYLAGYLETKYGIKTMEFVLFIISVISGIGYILFINQRKEKKNV